MSGGSARHPQDPTTAEHWQNNEEQEEHPSIPLLVAYHRGELTPEQEEQIQDHFLACESCQETMLALVDFLSDAPDQGRFSDEEIVRAFQELQAALECREASLVD